MIHLYRNNNNIYEEDIDKKQQNQINPYFQGALHTVDNSFNKFNQSQSNQNQAKSIRLFSAKNNFPKNKKYESQEKLKIYKNNSKNFKTIQNRPTSVKQKQNNFIYQQKRKGTELNYPHITLTSVNSQNNNIPLQRRRKIIYEEDNELAEEYGKLRNIWREAGVTDVYIDNFETITNNQNNNREEILLSLKNEKQQMIKFKEEMLKVVSEIIKRENDIKNIKELNKKYLNLKTRININANIPKRNIKNNNFIKDKKEVNNIENENENDEI